jgi:hypothetical protein
MSCKEVGGRSRRTSRPAPEAGEGQDRHQPSAAGPRPVHHGRARGPPGPPARGAPGVGPAWVDTGLVFTREDGQVMHPEHVTKRFAAGAGRRPAADHPARRAPQPFDRGAGGRRAAHGRVRAARACQQLDHRQPLPARVAVDGRAHRQRRRQPVGAAVGARDRLQAGPGGEAQRPAVLIQRRCRTHRLGDVGAVRRSTYASPSWATASVRWEARRAVPRGTACSAGFWSSSVWRYAASSRRA